MYNFLKACRILPDSKICLSCHAELTVGTPRTGIMNKCLFRLWELEREAVHQWTVKQRETDWLRALCSFACTSRSMLSGKERREMLEGSGGALRHFGESVFVCRVWNSIWSMNDGWHSCQFGWSGNMLHFFVKWGELQGGTWRMDVVKNGMQDNFL